MFGLHIGPKILWREITGSPEVQKLEVEIRDFFSGVANYLLHKHGAEILHIAINAAVTAIRGLIGSELSGGDKHAMVKTAVADAVKAAGKEMSSEDLNSIIEIGLQAVTAHNTPS